MHNTQRLGQWWWRSIASHRWGRRCGTSTTIAWHECDEIFSIFPPTWWWELNSLTNNFEILFAVFGQFHRHAFRDSRHVNIDFSLEKKPLAHMLIGLQPRITYICIRWLLQQIIQMIKWSTPKSHNIHTGNLSIIGPDGGRGRVVLHEVFCNSPIRETRYNSFTYVFVIDIESALTSTAHQNNSTLLLLLIKHDDTLTFWVIMKERPSNPSGCSSNKPHLLPGHNIPQMTRFLLLLLRVRCLHYLHRLHFALDTRTHRARSSRAKSSHRQTLHTPCNPPGWQQKQCWFIALLLLLLHFDHRLERTAVDSRCSNPDCCPKNDWFAIDWPCVREWPMQFRVRIWHDDEVYTGKSSKTNQHTKIKRQNARAFGYCNNRIDSNCTLHTKHCA